MYILFTLSYRSAHYNNLQKQEEEEQLKSSNNNNTNKNNNNTTTTSGNSVSSGVNASNNTTNSVPLRENSNIKPRKSGDTFPVNPSASNSSIANASTKSSTDRSTKEPLSFNPANKGRLQARTPKSLVPKLAPVPTSNERPLKFLESLAQKAGGTHNNESLNQPKMEKAQNQPQAVPLQITQEQLQQFQHQFQLQQFAAGGTAIQVKQEFPTQTQASTIEQLNKQIQEQQNQAAQVQQMQLIDAATSQQQAQNNAMGIKYVNGKFDTHFACIETIFFCFVRVKKMDLSQWHHFFFFRQILGEQQQQQQTSTTMTTMPPLQLQNGQLPADWNQRGIQVVQQPGLQQNPAYVQTIYGPQVLMPGNLLQQGFNQQPQIQVIAAGKPMQGGQITPQMLATAQGQSIKPVIGNSTTGFSGYALPNQSQTLLFSPVNMQNMFSSQPQQQQQQQNILPMTTTATPNTTPNANKTQQQELKTFPTQQKVVQQKTNTVNAAGQTISTPTNAQQNQQQCVQVSQSAIPTAQIINQIQQSGGQQMQFTAPVRDHVEYVYIFLRSNRIPSLIVLF